MKNTKERTLGPNDIKVLKRVIGLKSGKDVAVWITGAKQALAERANLLRFTELYQEAHVVLDRLSVDGSGERTVGARIKIMESERVALVDFLNKRGISQKIGDKPAPLVNRIMQFAERQAQAVLALNNPKVGDYRVRKVSDEASTFEVERYARVKEGVWPARRNVEKWIALTPGGMRANYVVPAGTYASDADAHAAIKLFKSRGELVRSCNEYVSRRETYPTTATNTLRVPVVGETGRAGPPPRPSSEDSSVRA